MCGLAGVLDLDDNGEDLRGCMLRMVATLAHRGPDDGGVYVDENVALGHRRLSILDLTPTGAQPMSLSNGGPVIVLNGEIYNFRSLRQELELLGCPFRGRSDTEVLLRAYVQWGMEGLKKLEGIFALGLWDPPQRKLVIMRDRFGVKPLFYTMRRRQLFFASEIKALLAAGDVDTTLDEQAFSEYLWYGNTYENRTMYRSVRSLLPGHWLVVEGGRSRIEPWWRLEDWFAAPSLSTDVTEAVTSVRESIDAAVKRQLVADVPVGIFLSGGVDSSTIAAAAMHVQSRPLSSYSVGFDYDRGVNELPKARRVAESLGLVHNELHVSGADLPEVLISLARAHDEPFADAANIPLFLLARQLTGSVKVVLQGDGGDEMFAGYNRYAFLRYYPLWRMWPRRFTPLLRAALGNSRSRFGRLLDVIGAPDAAQRMALLVTTETPIAPPTALLNADARNHLLKCTNPFLAYERCAERFRTAPPMQQMLLTDMTLQLPGRFLPKVDRATMACGIEARVPLLDEGVAALAVNLPENWKVRRGQKKFILREALRGRVPTDIVDGPKTGFDVPYKRWLKTTLFDFTNDCVLNSSFVAEYGLSRARLERTLQAHRAGTHDHGFALWKILQLSLWSMTCR